MRGCVADPDAGRGDRRWPPTSQGDTAAADDRSGERGNVERAHVEQHEDGNDGRESDAVLVERVRGGDDTAYSLLWSRHEDAARQLASHIAAPSEVDDLVAETFTGTLDALRAGGGPDTAFRPYLVSALRRRALDVTRSDATRFTLSDEMA